LRFRKKKEAKESASLELKEKELYRCGHCREIFPKSKAIVVLDYTYKPVKKFWVCPFCKSYLSEQIIVPKESVTVSQTLQEPITVEKAPAVEYRYQIDVSMEHLGDVVKLLVSSFGAYVTANDRLIAYSKKPLDSNLEDLKKSGKIDGWRPVP
jgi:hypothetical protein